MLTIRPAQTGGDIDTVRELFGEYQTRLGVDLCFQGFKAELAGLPGDYAPPGGRLFLAENDGVPVGCVALRALTGARCEMKRLFVRPAARGLGVGRALVARVIDEARALGYAEMVLDTLPAMAEAQHLYQASASPCISSKLASLEFVAGMAAQRTRFVSLALSRPLPAVGSWGSNHRAWTLPHCPGRTRRRRSTKKMHDFHPSQFARLS